MDNQYITHNDNSNREEEGSNKEEGSDKEEGNSTVKEDGESTDSEYSENGGRFVANLDKISHQWSDEKWLTYRLKRGPIGMIQLEENIYYQRRLQDYQSESVPDDGKGKSQQWEVCMLPAQVYINGNGRHECAGCCPASQSY